LTRSASLPAVCREPGTAGRKVGGATTDIAGDPSFLELGQGKAPIGHQRFVRGEERLGLVEQPALHGRFPSLGHVSPDKQARQGQALGPDGADTRHDAEHDSGQRFACLAAVVLGGTPVQARTPEADQITSHRTVAPVPVGLPMALVVDQLLPGRQEPRGVPAPIRECSPRTPHRRRRETEGSEAGDDGAAALEQAPAEEHPEQVEEAQIRTDGHASDDARQNAVETVN